MKTCGNCETGNVDGFRGMSCPMAGSLPPYFKSGCSAHRLLQKSQNVSIPTPEPVQVRTGRSSAGSGHLAVITLTGQIRGGKNNMGVTRTGRHYPKPEWAAWRDKQLFSAKLQFDGPAISEPCAATVLYWAGDRKRRDVPAIIDAIWHVLEKAGLVEDDSLIKSVDFRGSYDKENPRAEITIYAV